MNRNQWRNSEFRDRYTNADTLPKGPVLLIDDIVDSGWTLTVLAALLRRAGSGPVWPVVLATANL